MEKQIPTLIGRDPPRLVAREPLAAGDTRKSYSSTPPKRPLRSLVAHWN